MGRCVRVFEGHREAVLALAVSLDGRYAVSGSADGTVRLWNLATGQCLQVLKGHRLEVGAVALTPDGRYALSGSGDKTLRVWDLRTGQCLQVATGHRADVTAIAVTPDGRHAISGSLDNTLRLWELDWEYECHDPANWDEGARPYLEIFLTLHTPVGPDGFTHVGTPTWTEGDFQRLLTELRYRGYGWLRPEGVRRRLEELAAMRGRKP